MSKLLLECAENDLSESLLVSRTCAFQTKQKTPPHFIVPAISQARKYSAEQAKNLIWC